MPKFHPTPTGYNSNDGMFSLKFGKKNDISRELLATNSVLTHFVLLLLGARILPGQDLETALQFFHLRKMYIWQYQ